MIIMTTGCGESIYAAAENAVLLARREQDDVGFDFNDILLRATPSSNPVDIAEIYNLRHGLRQLRPFA